MNHTNGADRHESIDKENTSAAKRCPTCGAKISRQALERILRTDEAREAQLAEASAAIARQREELERSRAEIAEAAAAEESAKWEVEAQRAAREMLRLKASAAAAQERAEQQQERKLTRLLHTISKMQARIEKVDAAARMRVAQAAAAAKRDAEARHRTTEASLRDQLCTTEKRRQREADGMKRTIAELSRKAEAREQVHFGPEGEEALVTVLRGAFPGDRIEHHGQGGDVVHHVIERGKSIAKIVFEVKNAKSWESAYVTQTRDAMKKHETIHGVLVTRTMPARQTPIIAIIDDVIVVDPVVAAQVVSLIRDGIVAIARTSASQEHAAMKTEALIRYLRSDDFTGAMRRMAVKLQELRTMLSRERTQHDGWWRNRELAYTAILGDVAGLDAHVDDLLAATPANDNATPIEARKS
jgi:hypothetical protein